MIQKRYGAIFEILIFRDFPGGQSLKFCQKSIFWLGPSIPLIVSSYASGTIYKKLALHVYSERIDEGPPILKIVVF